MATRGARPPRKEGEFALRRTVYVAFILALVALAGQAPAASTADQNFIVVVHPDVQGTQIPRSILSSLFLKDVVRWGDGVMVRPVDQSLSSTLREEFTRQVLTVPVDAVPRFWQQKIMKGISPPPVKESDEDVIAYVATTRGAIGYVSIEAAVPTEVKPLTVID